MILACAGVLPQKSESETCRGKVSLLVSAYAKQIHVGPQKCLCVCVCECTCGYMLASQVCRLSWEMYLRLASKLAKGLLISLHFFLPIFMSVINRLPVTIEQGNTP